MEIIQPQSPPTDNRISINLTDPRKDSMTIIQKHSKRNNQRLYQGNYSTILQLTNFVKNSVKMVPSKIYSPINIFCIFVILFISVCMSHPTNCTEIHNHTSAATIDSPLGGPKNHSIGFIGQQRNMTAHAFPEMQDSHYKHGEPCMSEGARPDSIVSKGFLATFIAIILGVALSM
ncbi:uncharacterized protein GGS22DRAFT_193219 [Annulohypoxylon maeteangense]|uniref:uncharacterized protein n=1 Tax=Annulohypoxylon maeteangense TaxID=1927788 RepID=UPI00200865AC|nr:uncharacterized protein GGS22DRAFT_193219 [Annulohypoxylon maeteangense]KAI0880448.1 hypothetical protein GGS22DRAFT_193219 [Annulohypoxylon maeteangense]